MSEQLHTPSYPDLSPEEVVGWEQLAQASKQWPPEHEGLQKFKENHVHRILAEKGFEHLISNYLVTNEDEPAREHAETEWTPKTEQELSDAISVSLSEALAKMTADRQSVGYSGLLSNSHFLKNAQEAGIDTTNRADNEEFWDFFAEQTDRYVDKKYTEGIGMVELETMQVLGKLPQFLLAQQRLDENVYPDTELPTSNPDHPKTADKFIASRYNNLIREYMGKYPALSARAFETTLGSMAQQMRGYPRTTDVQRVNDTLWGAQVELAFGRILESIGKVRGATDIEDLQGIDLVADPDTHDEICFDVKASDHELDKIRQRRNLPIPNDPVKRMYVVVPGQDGYTRRDGTVVEPRKARVVFCPTPNSTKGRFQSLFMRDRFHMPDEMVAQATEGFDPIVDQVRQDLSTASQIHRRSS